MESELLTTLYEKKMFSDGVKVARNMVSNFLKNELKASKNLSELFLCGMEKDKDFFIAFVPMIKSLGVNSAEASAEFTPNDLIIGTNAIKKSLSFSIPHRNNSDKFLEAFNSFFKKFETMFLATLTPSENIFFSYSVVKSSDSISGSHAATSFLIFSNSNSG